ncbi:MarR family winged helix-turn-helix transcriptional regulator [Silvanigrella sp.]|jgi:DNA-binding MarR family transcriptional regulator|uniref:MarR family winged helix-turn-helix transcriptional regulator n=1 Tax=Silvanigrella sp. TaxID=2024976 RepID=UPI0037C5298E
MILRESDVSLILDQQLCFLVYSTSLSFNKAYQKLLKELGITYPQYLVMLVLWEKEPQTVSKICNSLYLETSTITPLLKRLESLQFIERKREITDERQVNITLTEKGRNLKDKVSHIPAELGNSSNLTKEEMNHLMQGLAKLRTALLKRRV